LQSALDSPHQHQSAVAAAGSVDSQDFLIIEENEKLKTALRRLQALKQEESKASTEKIRGLELKLQEKEVELSSLQTSAEQCVLLQRQLTTAMEEIANLSEVGWHAS
jgi:hypothetical protein